MTQPRFSPFKHIVEFNRSREQHQENSARLAHSFGSFVVTGWGEFKPEDPIMFDSPYLYRPSVSVGSSIYDEDTAEELRTTRYPRVGGTVLRWIRNNNGFYEGADVILWVEDRSPFIEPTDPDPDPVYEIVVDFTFIGIAFKDLPILRGDVKEV